jgi:hypothetical protein
MSMKHEIAGLENMTVGRLQARYSEVFGELLSALPPRGFFSDLALSQRSYRSLMSFVQLKSFASITSIRCPRHSVCSNLPLHAHQGRKGRAAGADSWGLRR